MAISFSKALLALPLLIHLSSCSNPLEHHATNEDHNVEHKMDHGDAHHHASQEVSGFATIPTVALKASRDAMAGWNVQISTENFRFTPENVNAEPLDNEGHAHLYLNGIKLARLYGNWYHIDKIPAGTHTLRVTLNANDHSELVLNNAPIDSTVTITQ